MPNSRGITFGTPNQKLPFLIEQSDRRCWCWIVCLPSHEIVFANSFRSYTDAYDIFAVNFANVMIGYVYFPTTGALPSSSDTALKIGTSAGTVCGQLGFGFLADHLGRKKVISRLTAVP